MSEVQDQKVNSLYNATLCWKHEVSPGLFIIRIKPDAGFKEFKAGQYVAIGLVDESTLDREKPRILKRAYSIGSSPLQSEYIEFYIAEVKDGSLTPRLMNLNEGDRMFVAPKITGTFVLDDIPKGHNLILVSTGTGIAPYLSMLRTPSTWELVEKIVLVHGVRFTADLGYRDELELLEKNRENSSFAYYPVTSRDDSSKNVRKGYAQHIFTDGIVKLNPEVDHVFACGNPAMISDVEKFLIDEYNYSVHSRKNPGNLHLEKYW